MREASRRHAAVLPAGLASKPWRGPSQLARALAILALAICSMAQVARASAQSATLGLGGWQVQSSAVVPEGGAQVSSPGFRGEGWLAVKPDDAGAVGTEIGALLQNGRCPDVFFAEGMRNCFGYMSAIGPDTVAEFSVPWWFRSDFQAPKRGSHAELIVNGVVGQADLWVNGRELATQATLRGAFTSDTFDVTHLLRPGGNSLALELYPNDPTRMFTLDDVDWNQIPPDNNTGIQFPLELHTSGALAIGQAHVRQSDAGDLSSAALTPAAEVSNASGRLRTATVTATVTPPVAGATAITVARTVTLARHSTQLIAFSPSDFPQLRIQRPQVWWPYQMGAQPLYGLSMSVSAPGEETDSQTETFAIRTISSYLTGASPIAPDGVRQFAVNGVPFVVRAGGWAEDMFLRYSSSYTAQQIAMIKNLGLDAIRTEGKQMPADFYEQMDRAGILIDAGYQCCDAWQPEHRKLSAQDYLTIEDSALTIGEQLRNHPSVFSFSWSDNAPTSRQEAVSLAGFARADFEAPLIASAEYRSGHQLGPSGEKEGPYDWVPPSYWYDATHYDPGDPTRTNVGGAWGFDSEASAGDTVPTLDSIQRFMSPEEQTQLWRNPSFNQYHANYEPELPSSTNGGYSFGTLYELDKAIAARYGAWSSLAQYVQEAQLQNYETQRAQFEAYIAHANARPTPSTGVVYWQLNKGAPTLLWDLYNQEFDQAGSYFGAQEANAPLHALYAYDTHTVSLANLTGAAQSGLTVQASVYDLKGKLLDEQSVGQLSLAPQQLASGLLAPKIPPETAPPQTAQTYFVALLVKQDGAIVDRNTYWLSTQPDLLDWSATLGVPHASTTQQADLTQLRSLAPARLRASASTRPQSGPAGADTLTSVSIANRSTSPTVALFLRADVRRGNALGTPGPGDSEVLPVLWSKNDTSLWPGESETLTVAYRAADLHGALPVISVSGLNVGTIQIPGS